MVPPGDLRWPSLAIVVVGLLSVGPVGVLSQTSTAVCLSSFSWMDNSLSQNPCVVSAFLQGACNDGQFTVDPLPVDTHYTGPYVSQVNACQCSSVTYNTISACGLCQNRTIITWTAWDTNCTTVYPGVFPLSIPQGTAVPNWAFQDVTTSNLFNATLAQSVGDNPESTATNAQSTGSVVASTLSASLTDSPTDSSTSTLTSTSSSSSSNTGAIAGGVVGGVVGVALSAAAIAFFLVRRKRSQVPASAQFTAHPTPSTYTSTTGFANAFTPPMAQPRLYDPSDPSTFPASPPPTSFTNTSSNIAQSPTVSYSTPSMHPGYYSGAPEI